MTFRLKNKGTKFSTNQISLFEKILIKTNPLIVKLYFLVCRHFYVHTLNRSVYRMGIWKHVDMPMPIQSFIHKTVTITESIDCTVNKIRFKELFIQKKCNLVHTKEKTISFIDFHLIWSYLTNDQPCIYFLPV